MHSKSKRVEARISKFDVGMILDTSGQSSKLQD